MKGIKSMYVNIVTCVRAKRGESRYFRIDSGVRQCCIMSPWLFNNYMDTGMKEMKIEMRRMGIRFLEVWKEWRLTGLLYADNLVLRSGSEEDLKMKVGVLLKCEREEV